MTDVAAETGAAPSTGNRRGAATRERVLAAADLCFERDGLDLTLDQVAREADEGLRELEVVAGLGWRAADALADPVEVVAVYGG